MVTTATDTARYLRRTAAMRRESFQWDDVTWRNVGDWDLATFGAIARLDPDGREYFNFPQTLTLKRGVRMGTTPTLTLAVETLAVNVLAPFVADAFSDTRRSRLRVLARAFAEEVLAHAAGSEWRMSRDAIRSWLASNTDTR